MSGYCDDCGNTLCLCPPEPLPHTHGGTDAPECTACLCQDLNCVRVHRRGDSPCVPRKWEPETGGHKRGCRVYAGDDCNCPGTGRQLLSSGHKDFEFHPIEHVDFIAVAVPFTPRSRGQRLANWWCCHKPRLHFGHCK